MPSGSNNEIRTLSDMDRQLAVLDVDSRPSMVRALGQTFRLMTSEDQAKAALRVMKRLESLVEDGTYQCGDERRPIPARAVIRAAEVYGQVHSRYLELAMKYDPAPQQVEVRRVNVNVEADPAVIAERERAKNGEG